MVGGDAIELDVEVGAEAALLLTTQGSTKVYRGASSQTMRASVDGLLVSVPEPIACFRDARYQQESSVSLGPSGTAVLVEGFTSGRAAHGDRWDFACLTLRTNLHREGRAILRDATSLDRDALPIAPRFGAMDAFFTIVADGPMVSPLLDGLLADRTPEPALVVAASRLGNTGGNTGAIVRVAARSPALAAEEVRRRLRNLSDICGGNPWSGRR